MFCKCLLVLVPVGVLVLFLTGSARSDSYTPPVPGYEPKPEPPLKHTMTIYNGDQVMRQKFVWQNGSWRTCGYGKSYDVFCRDCPRASWQRHGPSCSPRRAKEVACSPRATCKAAPVSPWSRR